MRTLIVTGADETFLPLLRGLLGSLQQWRAAPANAIACFDLGLAPQSRAWVAAQVTHLVEPGWDLPVADVLRVQKPHLRALTVRPFLPRYFPGYDVYIWIDADAWVQEYFAIDWLEAAAVTGALAAVPHLDRAYRQSPHIIEWRVQQMQAGFGTAAAELAIWSPYFNAGVFAMTADAPHWRLWQRHFSEGLKASKGLACCDQSALNHMLWSENLPVHPLPALCNWLCHLAEPDFDFEHRRFRKPFSPQNPIGILHLTAHSKDTVLSLRRHGVPYRISLHFLGLEPASA